MAKQSKHTNKYKLMFRVTALLTLVMALVMELLSPVWRRFSMLTVSSAITIAQSVKSQRD